MRPHVEFANQVWGPHLVKHIVMLENVQKRATKLIPGMKELSYEERLKILYLPTLSYRRIRGDLIETYKILTGKYDPNVSSILPLNNNQVCRGHKKIFYKRRPRLDIRKYSFCYRIVDIWNILPSEIVEAKSVYSFERRLGKFFKDQPIKFNFQEVLTLESLDESFSDENEELVSKAGVPNILPEEDLI